MGNSLSNRVRRACAVPLALVAFMATLVVAFTAAAVPTAGATVIEYNGTMEGSLEFPAGSWVNVGYHFKSDQSAPVTFVGAKITVPVSCSNGGPIVGSIVVPMDEGPYTPDPGGYTPWEDQADKDPLPYQGVLRAPDLCNGGNMFSSSHTGGGIFYADAQSSVTSKLSIQFHYRIPAGKGKPNTNCLDTSDPNHLKADVCGASMSSTQGVTTSPGYICTAASSITQTSAVIGGSTSNPNATKAQFVLDPAQGSAPDDAQFTAGPNSTRVFEANATGLTPNTTYSFRVRFLDNAGTVLGTTAAGGCPFTTQPIPPSYVCVAGNATSQTTATISGRTTNANATAARFVLAGGPGSAPNSTTPVAPDRTFQSNATGLAAGTAYTFQVEFLDNAGAVLGTSANSCPFNTPAAPTYVCVSGTATSSTTATLVGRTSDANATQATFVLVGGAGNAPADLSASAPDRTFESAATGLTPGANYTFKVEFRDGGGTLIGTSTNSCPFTPPVPPTYVCVSGTATSSTTATLGGRTTDTNATQATFVLSPAQGTAPADTTAAGPDATFESSATGLTPNTNYTFRSSSGTQQAPCSARAPTAARSARRQRRAMSASPATQRARPPRRSAVVRPTPTRLPHGSSSPAGPDRRRTARLPSPRTARSSPTRPVSPQALRTRSRSSSSTMQERCSARAPTAARSTRRQRRPTFA